MNLKYFTAGLTVTGRVKSIDPAKGMFILQARSGDNFEAYINGDTYFYVVRNSDRLDRDRTDKNEGNRLKRYLCEDQLVSVYGILYLHDGKSRFDVKKVTLYSSQKGQYDFEDGHWWITQITSFGDSWIKRQFGLGANYDFTRYRTNLNAVGEPTDNPEQELDTISRLLYGLSSAYMLTGNDRYLDVVRAGVRYQRDMFRTTSIDGTFLVWHHSVSNGTKNLPSYFNEDSGSIPLYEQIYAIAGLAQYFKATNDWEAINDIRMTLRFFESYFRDKTDKKGFFSHVDPVSFLYNTPWLQNGAADNSNRKNWNSVGDHTPAYMLNIMLAIEGIPELQAEFDYYKGIQKEMADLICDKFVDKLRGDAYIQERFFADWKADKDYAWQKDRSVIGHNLKIAWNLTRLYHLFGDRRYLDTAEYIADKMPELGMDMIRGGWYDVVEREPKNEMFIDFPWHNRKTWWQQEQGILAYLILAGSTESAVKREKYLDLARESTAFWNMAFLDQDYGETYFDVLDNGFPYLMEDRAQAASHSKSGYHSMELNYLAHIYTRLLIKKKPLRLYFEILPNSDTKYFNLMPDYINKSNLKVTELTINGRPQNDIDPIRLQLRIGEDFRNEKMSIVAQIEPK